jgi:hypothetical protein
MKPYIPRLLQYLYDGDSDRRVEFCERFLAKLRENEKFSNKDMVVGSGYVQIERPYQSP